MSKRKSGLALKVAASMRKAAESTNRASLQWEAVARMQQAKAAGK